MNKKMRNPITAGILCLFLLFTVSCSVLQKTEERQISVVISNECEDEIYGLHVEYFFERNAVGGLVCSKTPEMDIPLPSEEPICPSFPERAFPLEPENGKFGMILFVSDSSGNETPLGLFYEWQAQYGEKYRFVLSGNRKDGYVLYPESLLPGYLTLPAEDMAS